MSVVLSCLVSFCGYLLFQVGVEIRDELQLISPVKVPRDVSEVVS
jgi:hypothetical protein